MSHLSLFVLAVALIATPPETTQHVSPFACDRLALTAAERHRHFEVLGPMLRAMKIGVRELPNGYEFSFRPEGKTIALLAEYIEQERRCCPFFAIELRLEPEGGPVWMRFTGREGTKQFIQADAGPWIQQ